MRRRRKRFLLFTAGCLIAFILGKMIGRAEKEEYLGKRQLAETVFASEDELKYPGKDADTEDGGSENGKPKDGKEGSAGFGIRGKDAGESSDILLLVNRDHPLPEDYGPELVTLQDGVHKSAKAAYGALCDMLRAGIREGLTFEICSAYRSVERQRQLFEEDVNALTARGWSYERAWEEVARETMPPGCSEHNTGLAFDIVSLDYQVLDERQEETAENIWLRENCAEYGFILRYPRGSEEITGISYESWHFRYVGKDAAAYITEHGITLEEYLSEL